MKIAIVGAGAIGGLLAVRLALSGQDVTVIDRGAHLDAIRERGLKLVHADGTEEIARGLKAVSTCAEAGQQDLVFLALKANVIAQAAPQMRSMFNESTAVVSTQNGLPWWYFQNFKGPHAGYRLKTADPDGVIEKAIEARRIIGCVVYPAGALVEPGVIEACRGRALSGGRARRGARPSAPR